MNERIKELYERSFITDDYVNVGINGVELGIRFDPEKFAELIVQDCINIVKSGIWKACAEHDIALRIKEHFGVE